MYKLMVVEDEWITRNSLVNGINWGGIDCEVAGEAKDGLEAVSSIESVSPDIIITDIRMNRMDGIELCQYVKEHWPSIKIIIITGYGDFEYAKTALKLGVKDFILKPTDPDELIAAVQKTTVEIRQDSQKREELLQLQNTINDSIPILRERFFLSIISGETIDTEQLKQKEDFLQINLDNFNAVIMEIDDYSGLSANCTEKDRQLKRLVIKQMSQKTIDKYSKGYFIEKEANVFILLVNKPQNIVISDLCEEIQREILDYINISVSMGISFEASGIEHLQQVFMQGFEALQYKFYAGDGSIILAGDIHKNSDEMGKSTFIDYSSFINSISVGNCSQAVEQLNRLLNRIRSNMPKDGSYIKYAAVELMMLIQRILNDRGVEVNEVLPIASLYADVSQCSSFDEIHKILEENVIKAASFIQNKNKTKNQATVARIMEYLEQHFKENITLLDLASIIYMNPKYLGRLIKKETGSNFSDILTLLRIKNAKELMKDLNYKNYEIAQLVGINDSRYFSQMFKKAVGMTPTEYRETIL